MINAYKCSAHLPPCACPFACCSSKGIFQSQSTSRPPAVPAHAPTPACTPRCFGYRDLLDSTALPMHSPAVARSRPLTVCGSVTAGASVLESVIAHARHQVLWISQPYPGFSPSSQSSAVASPGPDNACVQSTSPLCCAVILCKGWPTGIEAPLLFSVSPLDLSPSPL